MKLRIGCGEWGFRELPLEEHFKIARTFGFRTLEFGIGGGQVGRLPNEMTEAEISTYRAMVKTYDIATPHCCLENDFTLPDAQAHDDRLTATLSEIRLAASLGARQIRLFTGFTPYAQMTETIWERMFDAFDQADALCRKLGMSISIETHGRITMVDGAAVHAHTTSTHRHAIERLLVELPATVNINYDPGNVKAVDPEDKRFLLDLINERIDYCHLKDWKPKGNGWEAVAVGDDNLDYGSLLERMQYDGVYLIEYEPVDDVEDGIRRSLDYLRRIGCELEFV